MRVPGAITSRRMCQPSTFRKPASCPSPCRHYWLAVVALVVAVSGWSGAMLPTIQSGGPQARGQTTQLVVDPDVIDSERNHRLAGYALIGIALLVLASKLTPRGKRL